MSAVDDRLQRRVVRRIRELAEQRNVALTHLPDRAGISRSHFWDLMAGRKSPTLMVVEKLAAALGVDPSELVSSSLVEDLPREIVRIQRTGLRLVEGRPEKRYETCLPLVPLQAAASAFGDPQHVPDDDFDWVELERRPLRRGMFVAQVVGASMEPSIPDGSYCIFSSPVEQPRGKVVLVQLRDAVDPDTRNRYTVKRYEAERRRRGGILTRLTLRPDNSMFEPIVLHNEDGVEVVVVAELVEVLGAT